MPKNNCKNLNCSEKMLSRNVRSMLHVLHRFIYAAETVTPCFWIIISIISYYFALGTSKSNYWKVGQVCNTHSYQILVPALIMTGNKSELDHWEFKYFAKENGFKHSTMAVSLSAIGSEPIGKILVLRTVHVDYISSKVLLCKTILTATQFWWNNVIWPTSYRLWLLCHWSCMLFM